MAAPKYDRSKAKVGRPRKKKDIRKLVIEMTLANLGWAMDFGTARGLRSRKRRR
jgi:hypothetical protein